MILLGLLSAVHALITNFPLAWVGKQVVPKSAGDNVQFVGTVWNGAVTGINGLGAFEIITSPKNLITSEPPLRFKRLGLGMTISGAVGSSKVNDLVAKGQVSDLALTDQRLGSLAGDFDLTVKTINFGDTCIEADGTVSTNVLASNYAAWRWRGPVMAGPVMCEDGDLVMKLSGQDGQQSIKADLRVQPNGDYRAIVDLKSRQKGLDAILPLYGFEQTSTGYRLSEAGKWR